MTLSDLDDPEFFAALRDTLPRTPPKTPDRRTTTPGASGYATTDPAEGLFAHELVADRPPARHPLMKYLREEIFPTAFCVGCGGGTVLNAFARAVDDLRLDPKRMVCVTGIGCSSWIPSPYFLCDTLHTTHGRAVAFASGLKVTRPDLKVVVIAGDGDLAGIGGNHLIHAARRNIDLTVMLVNNFIYGMTGGQVAPTTPYGIKTTTTPHRNVEHPLCISELVKAAGATYVARWTTYHAFPLLDSMKYALSRTGFSFIEIMSQCPVSYGKAVGQPDAVSALTHFRDAAVPIEETANLSENELENRIVVGKLVERDKPEFVSELDKMGREVRSELRARLAIPARQEGRGSTGRDAPSPAGPAASAGGADRTSRGRES